MRRNPLRRLGMDIFMMMTLGIGIILTILIFHINEASKSEKSSIKSQGSLIVELFWGDDLSADIDLWVMSSADGIPVGYSNKGGPLFNLLRDDLGDFGDVSGRNMEIAYSRGFPDGEYIINAHLFNNKTSSIPIDVKLVVSLQKENSTIPLFSVTSKLESYGHEKTMARFMVEEGKYIPESLNFEPKRISPAVEGRGF